MTYEERSVWQRRGIMGLLVIIIINQPGGILESLWSVVPMLTERGKQVAEMLTVLGGLWVLLRRGPMKGGT